jgi:hypothetical protein
MPDPIPFQGFRVLEKFHAWRIISAPCQEDEFVCFQSAQCLHQSRLCDSIKDCPDGSDETYEHAHCTQKKCDCKFCMKINRTLWKENLYCMYLCVAIGVQNDTRCQSVTVFLVHLRLGINVWLPRKTKIAVTESGLTTDAQHVVSRVWIEILS